MPHLVIYYTPNLELEADMTVLCRALANCMVGAKDGDAQLVFPTGGVRVLAYPATHYAVSDGSRDDAFVYLNLRMKKGRSPAVHQSVGAALLSTIQVHFAGLFAQRHLGITLQIDEGAEVYDAKHSNIHPLYPNR